MYREKDNQISLAEFMSPLGKLDLNNRWARIANMIPWSKFEEKYAKQFCEDNGAPAITFRMAMGELIIKQRTGHSDEEVLQDILENPYMQYLIGLREFKTTAPFSASSMTNFRKYITPEMINEINDRMFRGSINGDGKDNDEKDNNNSNDGGNSGTTDQTDNKAGDDAPAEGKCNKETRMLDETCAPANIAYPTDVNILNEAREKLEDIIDALHQGRGSKHKPRTYRQTARKKYLQFIKQRKPRKKTIRKATGQQLRYVARDITNVDKPLKTVNIDVLSHNQQRWLKTIRELYRQQQVMYSHKTHSIDKRIVSIDQPHVRPIVRGKTNAPVEFGAKVSISLADGYAFIDRLDWEAYNEEALLKPAVEAYKERYGHYPKAVLADKIYRNRDNLAYCKQRHIRISGPRLGRPPKETSWVVIKQERKDSSERNAIEGKFGEGKMKYGLDRIMARLQNTSETVIIMSFFCMNLSRMLRIFLLDFIYHLIHVLVYDEFFVCWVFG